MSDSLFSRFTNLFNRSTVDDAIERLKAKERYPELDSNTVQWLYWAAHPNHGHQFTKLIELLKVCHKRALTSGERGLLLDALAIGHTNVTPARVQWAFSFAPKAVRVAAANAIDNEDLQNSVERAVVAATPFDPSLDENYEALWRRFDSKQIKAKGAFEWSRG